MTSSSPVPVIRPNVFDLHQAVKINSPEDVSEILDLDTADVNGLVCGMTVLSLTLYKDKTSLFKLILAHPKCRAKLDLNKLSKDEKARVEPPLVTACRLGNREAVKMLIHSGAHLEGMDSFSHTALWMATRQRYPDIVYTLLQSGANVNPSNLWTHSPLFFAVKYSSRRTEIAKILLMHGASVHIEKESSLLYCAIVQGIVHVARLIVEAGYQVSKDAKLRQELINATLTRNANLIGWLDEEIQQPVSLQRQARTTIRDHISRLHNGCNFLTHLYRLPLPKSVLLYLALHDDIQLSVPLNVETEL